MPSISQVFEQPPTNSAIDASSDAELLGRFAENADQAAFTQLVVRHVNLVYSTAIRRLSGDAHLAQDVTQAVFNDAARKARALASYQVFSSWLYTSTCFSAAKAVRGEQRRRKHEAEALAMNDVSDHTTEAAEWTRLRPFLDDALEEMKAEDREALLLRFFEARPFAEMGTRLQLSENAARMRVERALERLRAKLGRYGITSTAAILSGTLAAHAVTTAPAGLAGAVTASAIASIGSAGSAGFLQMLGLGKITAVSTAALLSAAAIGVYREEQQQSALKSEYVELNQTSQTATRLREEIIGLTRTAREVATLRQDDAALEKIKQDAAALSARLKAPLAPETSSKASTMAPPANVAYDLRQLDQPPRIKAQPKPKYPFDLRQAGVSGEATISFIVTPEGTVTQVSASQASHKTFEAAALEAVKGWTFTPGMKNGQPVAAKMVVPMVFQVATPAADSNWF